MATVAAAAADRVCPAAARKNRNEHRSAAAVVLSALLLVLLSFHIGEGQGSPRKELLAGGSAVDISALPSAAEQQALTHLHLHAAPEKAGYDSLLSNGPFVPPRTKMLEKLSRKSMLGGSIGIDGSVHLLRSAKQILQDRLRSPGGGMKQVPAPSGRQTVDEAAGEEGEDAEEALREQKRRLAAKLKKLEEAAGANEFYSIKELNT
ncbi:hypothetical protein GUITHDRAFT_105597 [Guillardia theta CCMP2712]|uniref:Uncharacterized protein n=1 Tax=Guillardia theta (strain CCMP2712) TaxID=905079 RepID=L1JK32_GUITC|nr:hypothetical protein GUITHDRAFT_105597 [Guillardia theta CCMP2712]EKX48450.1 hypothetical protein GUITHDRAFT_105597 [Guillardia theta CCMP2712]|eukprot:XP_005835430.1 hypothetical protein GUITHDRAFT_105597 [Guillardia theta CCMP2712]